MTRKKILRPIAIIFLAFCIFCGFAFLMRHEYVINGWIGIPTVIGLFIITACGAITVAAIAGGIVQAFFWIFEDD